MENNQFSHPAPPPPPVAMQADTQQIYNYAAALLITQKKNVNEVHTALMQQGLIPRPHPLLSNLQVEID